MKTLCLMFTFAIAIRGQVPMPGKCPKLSVETPFNPDQYLGKWFEIEKYFTIFELQGKCITATYLSDAATGGVKVINNQYDIITNIPKSIEGTASFPEGSNVGKLSVVFPSIPFGQAAPYWVLDTDYTNYAVVYSCTNFKLFHTDMVWILTRSQYPSAAVLNQARSVVANRGLRTSLLFPTDQINCPSTTVSSAEVN